MAAEIDGADVVINLAGRSVNCRYNDENRRQMMESRVDSTSVVGEAIAAATDPPKVWLQASTATIYAHSFDTANDDIDGIIGGEELDAPDTWRFSIEVAKAWERAANDSATPKTRKVLMRSAMTMSPDRSGIFDVMLGLVRKGLGGTAGSGKQYISWIHDQDFIRSIYWLIEHDELSGPINISSPNPLPNREFMRIFRDDGVAACHRCNANADRDGIDTKKPSRRAQTPDGFRILIRISTLGTGGSRPLR